MDNVEDGANKDKTIATATDAVIEKTLRSMAGEDAMEMAGFPPESHALVVRVLHNANGLLSLGVHHWLYEGGNHGISFSEYVSFDVPTGEVLQLNQLLKTGYQNSLAEVGAKILRDREGLAADAPLTEAGLFKDRLELNDNWFVTIEGIGFSYDPEEIASFSRGFVSFTIPFSDLQPWLRQGTPLALLASQKSAENDGSVAAKNSAMSRRYYKIASQALANKQHYFDQKLDSLSMAIHQKVFDEVVRTRMAGERDKAKSRFSDDPESARKSISAAGPVPSDSEDMIELATWMEIAAKINQYKEQ